MNQLQNPFSIHHLPYGIVDFDGVAQLCVRLGNEAVSLDALDRKKMISPHDLGAGVTRATDLNPLIELGPERHGLLRAHLKELLGNGDHRKVDKAVLTLAPYPEDDDRVRCPVCPRDFVDFYCSRHHAFRVGSLFRGPENALPGHYFHLPIGYHGRSSTIFESGSVVPRPSGIIDDSGPSYQPTRRLDYELEVGFVLYPQRGPISPDEAWEKLFGVVLLNDWSARDIQAYEYRPLGPFLGKSFATTVGSWVTPIDALSDRRRPNTDSDHKPLPHLTETGHHHLDLPLEARLRSSEGEEIVICQSNLKNLAWSAAQMVSHLSSNNTVITAGDLIGTGTVSGPETGAEGSLLERTQGGKVPLSVGASTRTFVTDGDTVTLLGGVTDLGLAPCRATVIPATTHKE